MPAVSVCIPVYNGARYLRATLASVLEQDFDDFEVVVLDNASTDGTSVILGEVRDPRVRVERNDQVLSLPDNWRRVCDLARGRYLKVVCADDLVSSTCLRRQAEVLDANSDVSLVASRRDVVDSNGRLLAQGRGLRFLLGRHPGRDVARLAALLGINPIGESAGVMFRTRDYRELGGWDGTLVYPMDLDLWMRLLTRGDLYGQTECLAAYRVSAASVTSSFSERQYAEQQEFMLRVACDKQWRLPVGFRQLARVSAPCALWTWSLRHKVEAVRQSAVVRRPR